MHFSETFPHQWYVVGECANMTKPFDPANVGLNTAEETPMTLILPPEHHLAVKEARPAECDIADSQLDTMTTNGKIIR